MHDPKLLDRLAAIPDTTWEGSVHRFTIGDNPPERANYRGARWNPPDTGALYTSLSEDVLLAEMEYRLACEPFRIRAPIVLHTIRIGIVGAVDLRDLVTLAEMGVGKAELESDDYAACQRVGGAADWLGASGLFVPSVRYESSVGNLVLFTGAQAKFDFELVGRRVIDA